MARVKKGQKINKSDWEWQKLYNNYSTHYRQLNREEEGFHLLGEKYSFNEFKKIYTSAVWKRDHQDPSLKVNALEIARSQRRSNYVQGAVYYEDKNGKKRVKFTGGKGQRAMIAKLKKLEKGLKNNDPEAIAEYNLIKNNPSLQDAFETYTGTTLFDQDWVHYFDADQRTVENKRGNNYFKEVNNINQASFADSLDEYLDSLGLEHTKANYTMARDLFESAIY